MTFSAGYFRSFQQGCWPTHHVSARTDAWEFPSWVQAFVPLGELHEVSVGPVLKSPKVSLG